LLTVPRPAAEPSSSSSSSSDDDQELKMSAAVAQFQSEKESRMRRVNFVRRYLKALVVSLNLTKSASDRLYMISPARILL
jgi:hypothetical protein